MNKNLLDGESIFTITEFLSPEECADFIARSEQIGYEDATIAGSHVVREFRDNSRIVVDDPALADRLFRRAQPYLPLRVGNRELVGFNERFRYYRYRPGQMFKAHFDGVFHRFARREQSALTFMVYLNDDFTGGSTNFFFDLNLPPELGGQLRVRPVRGTALVFVHRQLHEGAPIEDGQKYVLRTDVMYGTRAKSAGGRAD